MIPCRQCRHYYITWDKDFSHGCHAMNFKSLQIPSAVVYENSGKAYLAFMGKEKKDARHLNDPKKDPVNRARIPTKGGHHV